jgi:hypothetical protein
MLGGLLNFNLDNLDDPKKLGLLQAGLSMMQGAPGRNKDFAADFTHGLQQGLLGLQMGKDAQFRREGAMQQRKLTDLQLRAAEQSAQDDQAMRRLSQRFTMPGNLVQNDDEGFPMPPAPQGFDMQGYANALPSIGPAGISQAMQIRQGMQKVTPFGKINPGDYTPESLRAFMQTGDYTQLRPREKVVADNMGGTTRYRTEYSTAPLGEASHTLSPADKERIPMERTRLGYEGQRVGFDRARLGMEGQRLGMDNARLSYDTGLGSGAFQFPTPQIPGVNLSGMTPKQQQAVAGQVAEKAGEATRQARSDLPNVEAQTQYTIELLDKAVKHPGFSTTVGAKGPTGALASKGFAIGGTDAADFTALHEQITGRQFMEAFQQLKGGGQITEKEGQKATVALARMQYAQSEKAYKEAAAELKGILSMGLERARKKAGSSGWSIRPLQ